MQRLLVAAIVLPAVVGGAMGPNESARLAAAARVVHDLRTTISDEYWSAARCVAVIPELKKAAFIVGGEYGKGVMSCRAGDRWSAPAFMQLAKGSWGFQAGAEQIDLVLLVMNEQGVQKLLQNQMTLGVDASVAAGPIGRQGQVGTDVALAAEIVAYSRATGLFAGINVSGGIFRSDEQADRAVYGAGASTKTILASREISAPTEAHALIVALNDRWSTTSPTPPPQPQATMTRGNPQTGAASADDLRAHVVAVQQTLDRILAETTPSPVGTSGTSPGTAATVTVDRARLLQMRDQLGAVLAAIDRR
jgi:lipid-binding SYLF domain-containing protein